VKITVVTNNPHKAREISLFFEGVAEVTHIALECPEIRHASVRKIAMKKAEFAYEAIHTPLICDDTGFYIHALRGFPGPYAAFVQESIGNEGIMRLMEGISDRKAHFETAVAYADGRDIRVFPERSRAGLSGPGGRGGLDTTRSSNGGGGPLPRCHPKRRTGSRTGRVPSNGSGTSLPPADRKAERSSPLCTQILMCSKVVD